MAREIKKRITILFYHMNLMDQISFIYVRSRWENRAIQFADLRHNRGNWACVLKSERGEYSGTCVVRKGCDSICDARRRGRPSNFLSALTVLGQVYVWR